MRSIVAAVIALLVSAPVLVETQGQSGSEIDRRQAIVHYRTGQDHLFNERYPEAEKAFSTAVALDPMLTLAHYGLGQSLMAQKRYAPAIQAFVGCREAFSRLAALRQSDAVASDRRLADEMSELRDSLARVRSGQIKGAGPAMEQQMEKRLEELETMGRSRAGDRAYTPAEVSLALGSAYYRNGQAQDAEREWLAAVNVNSRLGEAHNNLAVLYLQSGRKKLAEDAIKAAERARFRVHPQLKADIQKMK